MSITDIIMEAEFAGPTLVLDSISKTLKVENYLKDLQLSAATIKRVKKVFINEMNLGLDEKPSSLQMENTYLPELPNGTEYGTYLALDLGGTNFRILLLELSQGRIIKESVKHYHISEEQRIGCGVALFDYLASCIADFVKVNGCQDCDLALGFTFSFPMTQHSLNSGSLITWTKTFNCSGVGPDKDVVQMLTDSFKKCGVDNVRVLALLNDATGTLVAGACMDHRTGIGMILGTGSNACFLENTNRVHHWEGGHIPANFLTNHVVIDTEWGAFGDNGSLDFIKTSYDKKVDKLSLLESSFTFEKYISGKYLGEVVRCVLEELIVNGALFDIRNCGHLLSPYKFLTSDISEIEMDNVEGTSSRTTTVLMRLGISQSSLDDIKIVKHVCAIVSQRAAQLLSACLSALLERMSWEHVTVAVDGSLFKQHPTIKHLMTKYTLLLTPNSKFSFLLAEDGSGKGSALTAAVADRINSKLPSN